MAEDHDHSFSKARMESLTDALFATVMTILVLTLVVPIATGSNLSSQLSSAILAQLPSIIIYTASFIALLVMWIGHNNIFRHAHGIHPRLLWLNGIFLLLIGLVPFSTALLGRYPLQQPAILAYGINLLLLSIMFRVLTSYVCEHHMGADKDLKQTLNANIIPLLLYLFALVFSFLNPYISLALFALMPIYYLSQAFFGLYRNTT